MLEWMPECMDPCRPFYRIAARGASAGLASQRRSAIESEAMEYTTQRLSADFCVVGGGIAGLCAALAAARHGAKTVLVQDRPMLGGNASSEIRMHICGAHGPNRRETGIVEEIQLENLRYNAGSCWPVFDSVLWGLARREPLLTLLLDASVCSCETAADRSTGDEPDTGGAFRSGGHPFGNVSAF